MNAISRSLRPYQTEEIQAGRAEIMRGFKSVMFQLATGGGKTRMVANIIKNAIAKNIPGTNQQQQVWFVVPRKELLWQSSAELHEWKIQHGMIAAALNESSAFQTHICSKDTLIRRIKKKLIRKWPQIIVIDEAHLSLDQQLFIKEKAPDGTLFLGFTATPERLDGRGLNEMYETIVYGPTLSWLVDYNYLKRPKCYSLPQPEGLDKLKFNAKGDVSAKELTAIYKARHVYGDAIEHYRMHGIGRSFLVFCRSIEMSEITASEFSDAGFKVESIDGTMTDKIRKEKIDKVKKGILDGLTTVDLVTYGLDVPNISCIIMLRPTSSIAMFFQMIGRGLRPDDKYSDCLIFDHVGNCGKDRHGHPLKPHEWNFTGKIKKKKIPKDAVEMMENVKRCDICWDLIIDGKCRSCGAIKEIKSMKPLKQVDGWLVEINGPTSLTDRPLENQRHYQDMISKNIDEFLNLWHAEGKIESNCVKNLIDAAIDLKRNVMWVYHSLTEKELSVNVSLLAEIEKLQGYKSGWSWRKRQELEKK
jgi:superfamily II DNA or RNA helicase